MDEHLRHVYRPSVVLHLRIRFDEALHRVVVPDPKRADFPSLPGAGATTVKMLPLFDDSATEALTDVLAGRPGSSANRLSHVINIIPRAATIELPGHRQAGKFTATLSFRDLPIDPRIVRSVGVTLHVGTISADAYARGMRLGASLDDRKRSVLDPFDAAGDPDSDTAALVGVVDKWSATHGASGSEVHIEGRDATSLLLDSPFPAQEFQEIEMDLPIGDVVQQILFRHPLWQEFAGNVRVADPDFWPGGIVPKPAFIEHIPRHLKGPRGDKGGRGQQGASGMSFWDAITQVCFLVGAIPRFRGRYIEITPARGLYDQALGIVRTPFVGGRPRRLVDGSLLRVRRLVYGYDVDEVHFERQFTGTKAQVVEVVSLDTATTTRGPGKLIRARWPEDGDLPQGGPLITNVSPDGKSTEQQVLRIPVPGVTDPQKLKDIARDIFEEVMRGEMGGTVSTKHLASVGGSNDDPDVLRLRPGDAVEIVTRADGGVRNVPPVISELTDQASMSYEEQVAAVAKRLGDDRLARVIVASARGELAELQAIFYTSTVRFDYSHETGVAVSADVRNFVEARVRTPGIPELSPTQAQGLQRLEQLMSDVKEATR